MRTSDKPADFSEQIRAMFDAVAPQYDFLNRLLSARRDRYWRKQAVSLFNLEEEGAYLDVATGTADTALEMTFQATGNVKVVGIDFSHQMLKFAKRKIDQGGWEGKISLQSGSGEDLPYRDETFNGAISAFGIRNFADVDRGLEEMYRVLKKDGKLVILEFSLPLMALPRIAYKFYFNHVLPKVGRYFSKHRTAYKYLPQSVGNFPERGEFVERLEKTGFRSVSFTDLTAGISTIYSGIK